VARTEVVTAERPRELRGRAELSGATTGAVRWEIAPVPGGSQVSFSAHVEQASLLDRLLLLAGGRWWLGRIVRAAVGRLGAVLDAQLAVNS
jgi:Polyketide cyclase / dehydrase and lipid transport